MARSLHRLVVLLAVTQSGCVTAALWQTSVPLLHECEPRVDYVPTPIDPVPTGIIRSVRAGDGVIHLLCRCSDEVDRHYTTVAAIDSAATWPALMVDESLPILLEEAGPLPAGTPLVGKAAQDTRMAERVGEAPSTGTWSSVRFESGFVVVEAEDGSERVARLPVSRTALRPSRWPDGPIRAPRPESVGYTLGRIVVTPFAFLLDVSLTAIFWPIFVIAEVMHECPTVEPEW